MEQLGEGKALRSSPFSGIGGSLVEIKAKYAPESLFWMNHNVKPKK